MVARQRTAQATAWKRAIRWAVIALLTMGVAGLVSIVIAYYGASVFRAFSGIIPS